MRTLRIVAAFLFVVLVLLCASCTSAMPECATSRLLHEHITAVVQLDTTFVRAGRNAVAHGDYAYLRALEQEHATRRAALVALYRAMYPEALHADSLLGPCTTTPTRS